MEEKQKKKKNKRAYLNEFKVNEEGAYQYEGDYYMITAPTFAKDKWQIYGMLGIMIVFGLICGVLPAGGMMNSFYVILPWIISFVAICMACYELLPFRNADQPTRSYVKERIEQKVEVRLMTAVVGNVATAAGEILFMLTHLKEISYLTVAIVILQIICLFMGLRLKGKYDSCKWEKCVEKS